MSLSSWIEINDTAVLHGLNRGPRTYASWNDVVQKAMAQFTISWAAPHFTVRGGRIEKVRIPVTRSVTPLQKRAITNALKEVLAGTIVPQTAVS